MSPDDVRPAITQSRLVAMFTAGAAALRTALGIGDGPELNYAFDSVTSPTVPSTPASGKLRLNNADPTLATLIFLHETDSDGIARAPEISTWDDTYTTAPALLTLRSVATPANYVTYHVTGANTDSGAYDRIAVTFRTSNGTFTDGEALQVFFSAPPSFANYLLSATATATYLPLAGGALSGALVAIAPTALTHPVRLNELCGGLGLGVAANYTSTTRGTVTQGVLRPWAVTIRSTTSSRVGWAAVPYSGTAGITHTWHDATMVGVAAPTASGYDVIGPGVEVGGAGSDFYFVARFSGGTTWYTVHEVATVPTISLIRATNQVCAQRYCRIVVPAGAGAQTISWDYSPDGDVWQTLTTISLTVTGTGWGGTTAVPSVAFAGETRA